MAAESWGDEEGYLLVFYLRDVSAAGWCCWTYVFRGVWSGSNCYGQQGKAAELKLVCLVALVDLNLF